jgi:serine/threonine-protein kinase RsbT
MGSNQAREKTDPQALMAVRIESAADVVTARQRGRSLAAKIGFNGSDLTVIATAISELARNILEYALAGEMILGVVQKGSRTGLLIVARDEGPGIPDITKAMQDGYTTGKGLGVGLPGVRRLMDDFEITSTVGEGTAVTVKKWIQ